MRHILDNPIWNALNTGNKALAFGTRRAKYLKRDVGFFVGLKTNGESDISELYDLLPAESLAVLFTPEDIFIPEGWSLEMKKPILQMVYQQGDLPVEDKSLTPLQDKDIPAMVELTTLTNPGPFLPRTIDFGNYEGIFQGEQLIAMTGQRLQPGSYVEISAVCTHPDHLGKGYAATLVRSQIRKITAAARTPFLHVYEDNTAALKLYEKLGFQTRKQMVVYVLKKEASATNR